MSEEVNLDLVVVWVGVCASVANAFSSYDASEGVLLVVGREMEVLK